ncbi:MAG: hypothetical protein HC794_10285 [Nitrospiraceae bacterium]|nr:hypothetical protein [Nitrospiraceae bacterium]
MPIAGLGQREQLEQDRSRFKPNWLSGSRKNRHDTLLSRVREGLGLLDQNLRIHQEHVTEARLAAEGLRAKREHELQDQARVTQQIQETEDRRRILGAHLDSLKGLIEQSQTEQTRQEALCRELGEAASHVKGDW